MRHQKIAAYVRVSTDEQSTDSQEAELLRYAERRGWGSPIVYREKASGGRQSVRPVFEELLATARRGEIDVIIIYKLDRLGRSLSHLVLVIEELSAHRVGIVCTSQGIDTSDKNPVGKLQLNVLMAVAEFERELIRERTLAGLKNARAKGTKLGRPGTPKKVVDQVRRLREDEKLSVRKIRTRTGLSIGKISQILNTKEKAK